MKRLRNLRGLTMIMSHRINITNREKMSYGTSNKPKIKVLCHLNNLQIKGREELFSIKSQAMGLKAQQLPAFTITIWINRSLYPYHRVQMKAMLILKRNKYLNGRMKLRRLNKKQIKIRMSHPSKRTKTTSIRNRHLSSWTMRKRSSRWNRERNSNSMARE